MLYTIEKRPPDTTVIKLVKSTFYREEETKAQLWTFLRNASQLSFGPFCEAFEEQFAKYQGRRHCVFLNSGSSANLALVQALLNLGRIERGDAVGFSAVTWSTNVMPFIQLGLRAVPIDVELSTLNVSSTTLAAVLECTPLKMVLLTNLLGWCSDIDVIRRLCAERGMLLVEDTCEALGSVYKGVRLGNYGLASTFSFYVGHHLSTVEGGAVCTDDQELATMLRIVRAHGWDRNLSLDQQGEIRRKFRLNSVFESRYTFYDLGFNLRPTEVSGCLGTIQLKYIEEIVARRRANFARLGPPIYARTDRFYPLTTDHLDVFSNFAVPVVCRTRALRDVLVARCNERIEIRPIVGGNITQQPFYRKYMPAVDDAAVLNARLINDHGLYFGNNPEMTDDDITDILEVFAAREGVRVSAAASVPVSVTHS